jgi:hypothetical protein
MIPFCVWFVTFSRSSRMWIRIRHLRLGGSKFVFRDDDSQDSPRFVQATYLYLWHLHRLQPLCQLSPFRQHSTTTRNTARNVRTKNIDFIVRTLADVWTLRGLCGSEFALNHFKIRGFYKIVFLIRICTNYCSWVDINLIRIHLLFDGDDLSLSDHVLHCSHDVGAVSVSFNYKIVVIIPRFVWLAVISQCHLSEWPWHWRSNFLSLLSLYLKEVTTYRGSTLSFYSYQEFRCKTLCPRSKMRYISFFE